MSVVGFVADARGSGRLRPREHGAHCVVEGGVPTFLVLRSRSGPQWDPSLAMEEQSGWDTHAAFMDGLVDDGFILLGGPLTDEHRVVLAVEADSEEAVRATLARDPWSETHLRVEAIDPWTIRLDGRRT
jgi:uncharacterized protein YciI